MKAKLEFIRKFRHSYSREFGWAISEESPERYFIHWQLHVKGEPEYSCIPIKCQEYHDGRETRYYVCSEIPKYAKYFNTSEQCFFNTKKERSEERRVGKECRSR